MTWSRVGAATVHPALLFAFTLFGFTGPAAAQAVMLDLGAQTVIFAPKAEVDLPVTLNAPGEGPSKILMDVGFPEDLVTFEGVEPGSSAVIAGAQVRATEKPAQDGGAERVIAVEVDSQKPLATGTVLTFKFRLGPKAEPGSEIRVRGISRSATSAAKPLEAQGADGLITVVEPLPPCFFYMH